MYEPSEDTFVLMDTFEEQAPFLKLRFLNSIPLAVEIGTGSGLLTTFIQQNVLGENAIYLTTDINNYACLASLRTSALNRKLPTEQILIDLILCDLTSPILNNKVDLLLFNPPYVPSESVPEIPSQLDFDSLVDMALCGGLDGMEVTRKVLDQLPCTLSDIGVAYILFCARNKPQEIVSNYKDKWNIACVFERKAGWEVLSVWRFQRH